MVCKPEFGAFPHSVKVLLVSSAIGLAFVFTLFHLPDPFLDFRAFYCAGQAELAGVDPYREHPLHECERNLTAPKLPRMHTTATVPAPFPGFVLSVFALLARVPFAIALGCWIVTAWLAIGLSVVLIAKTARVPIVATLIVVGFPAAVVALPLGQVTPFILLALAGTAALIEAEKPRTAALASLAGLFDPHVGLALCLGLFVALRRTRAVFAFGGSVLLTLSIVASGPHREWEYFRWVLPAHAAANITDAAQFSATSFAYSLGAAAAPALAIGSVWYVASLAIGTIVALRLRRRLGNVAIAYVPTAFAVFGGTYTHFQQLALAIPAFLLLGAAAAGPRRSLCLVTTFIAAVPWLLLAPYPVIFVIPCALAGVFAGEVMLQSPAGLRLAAGSFFTLTIILSAILHWHIVRTIGPLIVRGNPLADVSWQMFTLARNVPMENWNLIARAPTVGAFTLLLIIFVGFSATKEPREA